MSYEIVKSVVIKNNRVFTRMSSNNVYPKDFTSEENPGLTKTYNEKGLAGLYLFLVEGGLSGYLHYDKHGNKMVKQIDYIVESIFEDKQYRNMKRKIGDLEYKVWSNSEKREEYRVDLKKYEEILHNYIDMKMKEYMYPKMKVPKSIESELYNVLEIYEENLENEGDDVFAGTQDSYAEEMLSQDIYNVLDRKNVERIMALNNNMYILLNIDFRNKSYDQIVEQITDKLAQKINDNIKNLDKIIEFVEEKEREEVNESPIL